MTHKKVSITNICFNPLLLLLLWLTWWAVFCLLLQIHFSTHPYSTLCCRKMTTMDHTNKSPCPHTFSWVQPTGGMSQRSGRKAQGAICLLQDHHRPTEGHCCEVPSQWSHLFWVVLSASSPYSFSPKNDTSSSSSLRILHFSL